MSEEEIVAIYDKSIWDMTATELIENGLDEMWTKLVDMNAR